MRYHCKRTAATIYMNVKLRLGATPNQFAHPSKYGQRKITQPIRAYDSNHERRNHQSEADDSWVI